MLPPTVVIQGLSKTFAGKPAVKDLSLTIPRGSFYALLGHNGAGKTTTLRMIAGLLPPDSGSLQVLGLDVQTQTLAIKQRIAFMPDEPMLYGKLTALECLEFVASLWSVPARQAEAESERLLRWLDLWEVRNQRAEGYSRGMQQKLALAAALVHSPELLVLDEPLTGLDASAARKVKDGLVERTQAGMTVLFTTHILEVAERLATRIGLISRGELLIEGSLDELRQAAGRPDATLEDLFLAQHPSAEHAPHG